MSKLTQHARSFAFEASLIAADLAVMAAQSATCAVRGHAALRWHRFASGDAAGICTRCSSTVVPVSRARP